MRWLWYVGPVTVALVYLLVAYWPSSQLRRRTKELKRWVDEFLGPLEGAPKKTKRRSAKTGRSRTASRWIGRLPSSVQLALDAAGRGSTLGNIVLIPKLAYLAVRGANRTSSVDHQTVVARLAKPAPGMVVRPLPLVEGRRVDNRGVQFKKDPEFMEHYLVEGTDSKGIVKWLRGSIREALIETPDIWLRAEGRMVSLTLYGEANAERLDELVAAADAVFAERGAGKAPSLFGDEDAEPLQREPTPKDEPQTVAALGRRLGAGILDAALYAIAAAVIIFVLSLREGGWADVSVNALLGPGPSDPMDGAWQGGWSTKGFGALVAAESLLCGLFVYQTYLTARLGESIGKRVFGARVVRLDGAPLSFLRAVLLRTWMIAAAPLVVAALLTGQINARLYLSNLFDWRVFAVAGAAIVLDVALLFVSAQRRSLHDYIAGTRVVAAPGGARRLLEL